MKHTKNYSSPIVEVLRLSSEDIVTVSGTISGTDFGNDNEGFFDSTNWMNLL